MKKKSFIMVLALVLVFAVAVGGVVAWLTDKTDPVKNTFTVGDINIKLEETTGSSYQVIPGDTQNKDPKVTVLANSEACYLFVKIDEANNTMTVNGKDVKIVNYAIANGWTQGKGTDRIPTNVYWREVGAVTADTGYYVFSGGTDNHGAVTINDNVTKGQINADNQPTLTFTAYAVQKDNIADAATAWAEATK